MSLCSQLRPSTSDRCVCISTSMFEYQFLCEIAFKPAQVAHQAVYLGTGSLSPPPDSYGLRVLVGHYWQLMLAKHVVAQCVAAQCVVHSVAQRNIALLIMDLLHETCCHTCCCCRPPTYTASRCWWVMHDKVAKNRTAQHGVARYCTMTHSVT